MDSHKYVFLAYCLQLRDDGLWLPLNRYYKPLGCISDDWIDYNAVDKSKCISLTSDQQRFLGQGAQVDRDRIYLYRDRWSPTPEQDAALYQRKLEMVESSRQEALPVDSVESPRGTTGG